MSVVSVAILNDRLWHTQTKQHNGKRNKKNGTVSEVGHRDGDLAASLKRARVTKSTIYIAKRPKHSKFAITDI